MPSLLIIKSQDVLRELSSSKPARQAHIFCCLLSSKKRNTEKGPAWNAVLCDEIHRYGGTLKIHIITKIYTSIRWELVYRPALDNANAKAY